MAAIPAKGTVQNSMKLVTNEASKSGGEFKATLEWQLAVMISSNEADMLADNVAGVFQAYLPIEGTVYPGRPFVTCRSVSCKHEKDGFYRYKATYSDKYTTNEKQTDENPLLDVPIVRPTASMSSIAIHRDRDNNAILNAAGDPIVESKDVNILGFAIEANVAAVPPWVLGYRDTVNDSPIVVGGLPIDTDMARIIFPSDWISEPKSRNEISYYVFKYQLALDERDRHFGYPLNAGFREIALVDEDGVLTEKRVAILEDDGSEPSQPVPLDEEGRKLVDPTPETATFRQVGKYPQRDFSVLPGVA